MSASYPTLGTKCLAVALTTCLSFGCAGAVRGETGRHSGVELLEEAERLEKKGAVREAAHLYLECFSSAQCPEVLRLLVGSDLRRVALVAPDLGPIIWKAVEDAEHRIVNAQFVSPTFTGDLASVLGLYDSWEQPERAQKLLRKMRGVVPPGVYNEALESSARSQPRGLTDLDQSDVDHLVSDIQGRAASDKDLISRGGVPPAGQQDLEILRVETAMAYASALLRSHHPEAMEKVLGVVVDGTPQACENALGEAEKVDDASLTVETCKHCPESARCKPSNVPAK